MKVIGKPSSFLSTESQRPLSRLEDKQSPQSAEPPPTRPLKRVPSREKNHIYACQNAPNPKKIFVISFHNVLYKIILILL